MENEKSIKTFFKRLYRKLVTQPVEDRTYTLSDGTKVIAPFSNTPMIFAILFVISVVSWTVTNVDIHRFISNLDQFFVILRLMIKQFDFSYSKEVFKPLIATVQMSILGSFLGALLALPIALLASSNASRIPLSISSIDST